MTETLLETEGKPPWTGEAWCIDDGLLLNLPVFDGCTDDFKRLLLRAVRVTEYEVAGSETWYDRDNDKICQISSMPEDHLPPLKKTVIGEHFDPHQSIVCGGDFDARLILVLGGVVEKLVGDAPSGGRCVVRTLRRGDCEGLTEFLGVGSAQRTCALRAGPEGAHVRFMLREAVQDLLKQTYLPEFLPDPDECLGDDEDEESEKEREPPQPMPKWPDEVAYFEQLLLERIDALPHDASRELLKWNPVGEQNPVDLLKLPGQSLFVVDDSLGLKTSGPLPEGLEERYFFDRQIVLKRGVPGDSLIMILRGEVEEEVPEGCQSTCYPAVAQLEKMAVKAKGKPGESWIGDGRREKKPAETFNSRQADLTQLPDGFFNSPGEDMQLPFDRIYISNMVKATHMKHAKKRLKAAAEAGELPYQEGNTDWSWEVRDPAAYVAITILEQRGYLSDLGQKKADSIKLLQHPPELPPPPEPKAVLRSGSFIGPLALLGVPVMLGGDVRAKGPVLIVVLHRHILLEALSGLPALGFFQLEGIKTPETIQILTAPKKPAEVLAKEGIATGPEPYTERASKGPGPGTFSAFLNPESPYFQRPGTDAFWMLLLDSIRECPLLWDSLGISDAPPRLLEQVVSLFQPRWLLANEVVVECGNDSAESEFMFIVMSGSFLIHVCGAEIGRLGPGDVQGEAQLLGFCRWTRTISVDPKQSGEAMIQFLSRERLRNSLLGHPVPKMKLRDLENEVRAAKNADYRILQSIPLFRTINNKPFLVRVFKDADVLLHSPGDHIAVAGAAGSSLIVVLAGHCRGEHAKTLFRVDLHPGDWCFQNNYLGNEKYRDHDVIVAAPTVALTLHRHSLLDAIVDHPTVRHFIIQNESWRSVGPQLGNLKIFQGVPSAIMARLLEEAVPRYYRQDAMVLGKDETIPDDALLLVLRGTIDVSIMGFKTRSIGPGETIGLTRYLDLPTPPNPCEFKAVTAVDAICLSRGPIYAALDDVRHEDATGKFKRALKEFGGGEVVDDFGFPMGCGGVFATDCVEQSDIFSLCSKAFVSQIGSLVEDVTFFPGEKMFDQGAPGTCMYFIQAGRVRTKMIGIKKDEFVDAPDTIGDMACLGQTVGHICTAIAETHVWARCLDRQLLQRALKSFPNDMNRILGSTGKGG